MKHIAGYLPQAPQNVQVVDTTPTCLCQRCGDQGMIAYKDSKNITRTRPCPNMCAAGQEYSKYLIGLFQRHSEIPDRYEGFTSWSLWENLPDEYLEGKITAIFAIRQFIKEPGKPFSKAQLHPRYKGHDTERSSLVITGERGMGKTALASTMVHLLVQKLIPAQFVTPRGLAIRLRETFDDDSSKENEAAVVASLIHVPVLVIDEFNFKASNYMVSIFEQIIRERYNALNARPVVVTANAKKDELIQIWGGQTISALSEMAHYIPMGGKPLRDEAGEVEEEAF